MWWRWCQAMVAECFDNARCTYITLDLVLRTYTKCDTPPNLGHFCPPAGALYSIQSQNRGHFPLESGPPSGSARVRVSRCRPSRGIHFQGKHPPRETTNLKLLHIPRITCRLDFQRQKHGILNLKEMYFEPATAQKTCMNLKGRVSLQRVDPCSVRLKQLLWHCVWINSGY